MLTHKSYNDIAPTYLRELISKRESYVNTRFRVDHHQLITLPISKYCSNTFLERSFMYAAPCEWHKLSMLLLSTELIYIYIYIYIYVH